MSEAPRSTSHERRRPQRNHLLIVMGVLVVLAAALAIAARDVWTAGEVAPPLSAKPQAAIQPPARREPQVEEESNVIDDDGRSLWVSPTSGPPLDLAYLPPGVEVILALRPAKLLADLEGEKVVAALGPRSADAIAAIENSIRVKLVQVERLVIGWQVARDGGYLRTMVVTTDSPIVSPPGSFQPESKAGRLTVVAPESALADIRVLNGEPPPLGRDIERLLSHTDEDRDVTLIIQPRSLMGGANTPFQGEFKPFGTALDSALGRDVAAAALSLNWGDNFFAEVSAVPSLDSTPAELSEQLFKQVDAWPATVEESIVALDASPYGRRLVARLPEMVRRLAAYTRNGYDRDAAILRCYLPAAAGHNLLMATELALAEAQGTRGSQSVAAPLAAASSAAFIAERLQKKTTLRFGREELEAALDMLADDVGVPITIRGRDLQFDGITRNQLFAIDLTDRPAEEILVEILRRANPDKTATGPADPRQKLVYVVGADGIIITTRSQAAARGEPLPAAFRAE